MKKPYLIILTIALLAVGCGENGGERIIERPNSAARSSRTLEIDKVILNDTATILYIDAFFRANNWIRIDSETYLLANGQKYIITGSDGIEIDEHHWMPETGEDSFVLFFPPLPKGVKSFDFIESDCDDCFKIWGVDLTGKMNLKSSLPKELRNPAFPAPGDELKAPELRIAKTKVDLYVYGIPEGYTVNRVLLAAGLLPTRDETEWPHEDKGNGHYVFEGNQYGTSNLLLIFNDIRSYVILEPGEHAEIHLDLAAYGSSQSRYSTLPEMPYIAFKGTYAKVNNEMAANRYSPGIHDLAMDPGTWRLSDEQYREAVESEAGKISAEIEAMDISQQLKTVYRQYVKNMMVMGITGKQMFMRNSEYMEKRSDDIDPKPALPTDEDYMVLAKYDLNNLEWLYNFEFFHYVHSLAASQITDAQLETITGGYGLAQDLRKARPAFSHVFDQEGASEEEMQQLAETSSGFYSEAYRMIREEAKAAREKALAEGGFTIKDNPEVANDKVLDAILAEYKGQPVFIDFWATWCGPCLQAMKTIKPLKPEMAEHGVVSIYISNPSSPEPKWLAMLPDIGGIHYYLTEEQWSTISNKYEIRGIPHYMIFDKSGNKTFQTAGFPGVDNMRKELEKVW